MPIDLVPRAKSKHRFLHASERVDRENHSRLGEQAMAHSPWQEPTKQGAEWSLAYGPKSECLQLMGENFERTAIVAVEVDAKANGLRQVFGL